MRLPPEEEGAVRRILSEEPTQPESLAFAGDSSPRPAPVVEFPSPSEDHAEKLENLGKLLQVLAEVAKHIDANRVEILETYDGTARPIWDA